MTAFGPPWQISSPSVIRTTSVLPRFFLISVAAFSSNVAIGVLARFVAFTPRIIVVALFYLKGEMEFVLDNYGKSVYRFTHRLYIQACRGQQEVLNKCRLNNSCNALVQPLIPNHWNILDSHVSSYR